MELELTEYDRKTFTVNAVELTFKNVEQVAKWCKGTVDTETTRLLGGADAELPVIKVQGQGEDKGKTLVARLGCFVVESKGRFRVYKAPQFHAAFELSKPEGIEISAVGPQPEVEIWINPGDTTDEIAGKLGFEQAPVHVCDDFCRHEAEPATVDEAFARFDADNGKPSQL